LIALPVDERKMTEKRKPEGAAVPLPAGRRVGNYRIERLLGDGGQATVYLAQDVVLKRLVALKVFRSQNGSSLQRWVVREGQLIATLDHINIVRLFHIDIENRFPHMAIEYVDGGSLCDQVRRVGPLEPVHALKMTLYAARALEHAADIGIVHRDVKPGNLLVTRRGHLKLADFGLATWDEELATSGQLIGTPQYLAPEIWDGNPADAVSDLYSLGGCLYYFLTGQPPFAAGSIPQLRRCHREAEPEQISQLSKPLAKIVRWMMHKKRAERPNTAAEVGGRLEDTLTKLTGSKRRPKRRVRTTSGILMAAYLEADSAVIRAAPYMGIVRDIERNLLAGTSCLVLTGRDLSMYPRLLREVIDGNEDRLFVYSRMTLDETNSEYAPTLAANLGLAQANRRSLLKDIRNKLLEDNSGPTLRAVLQVRFDRAIRAAELEDIARLLSLGAGRITQVITCKPQLAAEIMAHLKDAGYGAMSRCVNLPALEQQQARELLSIWLEVAEGPKWTDTALELAAHIIGGNPARLQTLAQNVLVIAKVAEMRLVTTWCVLAAEAHASALESPTDVLPVWRAQPAKWPDEAAIKRIALLRGGNGAGSPTK
jgi:tRNA A-37 threonylcarbamoyl transferase component Bud32